MILRKKKYVIKSRSFVLHSIRLTTACDIEIKKKKRKKKEERFALLSTVSSDVSLVYFILWLAKP